MYCPLPPGGVTAPPDGGGGGGGEGGAAAPPPVAGDGGAAAAPPPVAGDGGAAAGGLSTGAGVVVVSPPPKLPDPTGPPPLLFPVAPHAPPGGARFPGSPEYWICSPASGNTTSVPAVVVQPLPTLATKT
jgi:hypothetical protein